MRALFFPSYFGGGFGHIGRCLALAEELELRGWKTAFALGGPHVEKVHLENGFVDSAQPRQVYHLSRKAPGRSNPGEGGPVFTVIPDMNYQIVRDGYHRPTDIRRSVAQQLKVVRRFRPDVLVADVWPLAGILAHLTGLPLVQITRSIVHPAGSGLLWWCERPAGLVSPDPRPAFNPVLESWGMAPIQRAEDLLMGGLHLVPSIPELDPLPAGLTDTHYVGPLIRTGMAEDPPAWLDELDPNRPVVYVTTGGGADGVGGATFYDVMIEALGGLDVQVVVSTGSLSPDQLDPAPPNMRFLSWAPGPAIIARSDLVLFAGGYGTMMELVQAGKPGLVVPFHTEQESNGRRLEALGAGRVLLPMDGEGELVWRKWPGRSPYTAPFSLLVHQNFSLTPDSLRAQVLSALQDADLREGAKRLQTLAKWYPGPERAAGLIEAWAASHPAPEKKGWDQLSWWEKLVLQS